jgi:uncharacterized protein (DUF2461 family)
MSPDVLTFFAELAVNNNREWFMDNKSRYDAIHAEFVDFTAQIIDELSPLDPSIGHPDAKKCLYRIYRDLRFTQDKRPYKTHISFFLSSHGIKRSGEAGYYLQIGQVDEEKSSGLFDSEAENKKGLTGNCSLGGGIFMPDKDKLAAIRQEIFYNTDQFLAIRNEKNYKKYFGDSYFTTRILSRAPKGYPNDWEHVDLLKFNDYCTMHTVPNKVLLSDGFKDYVMKVFKASVPLNKFILQATS